MSEINDARSAALWLWFTEQCRQHRLGEIRGSMETVSGDASFRRYFRGRTDRGPWILVDAPPAQEDSRPFVKVRQLLESAGVRVPGIVASDLEQGFMCLEDFGDRLLLAGVHAALEEAAAERRFEDFSGVEALYRRAFSELLLIQHCDPLAAGLPVFDAQRLRTEMELFTDWLCGGILHLELRDDELVLIEDMFRLLIEAALSQPQVFVHRDYHSRNLMLCDDGRVGVIDFQDAVAGPFSYDLVSLLKDCYFRLPDALVETWALEYLHLAQVKGLVPGLEPERFLRDFHLMGAQRHLKASGIFCRLWLRDGKPGYLGDILNTVQYISRLQLELAPLKAFQDWLQRRILPVLSVELDNIQRSGRLRSGGGR